LIGDPLPEHPARGAFFIAEKPLKVDEKIVFFG
jgi:hypothetical protein